MSQPPDLGGPARFVAFEGGEGCGKSTQAARLAERLRAVLTREPGGTPAGARLRELVLDPATPALDPRSEALLMCADRAQHLAEVVRPALAAGRHVVSDRSAYSTLAYQGFGRGLDLEDLRRLCDWSASGRWPDVVVLLDLPVSEGLRRAGVQPDRIEAAGADFHETVRRGFATLAAAEPDRFVVVDATGEVAEVEGRVSAGVEERLHALGAPG